jgi:hypothetical protein
MEGAMLVKGAAPALRILASHGVSATRVLDATLEVVAQVAPTLWTAGRLRSVN